ncbi:P-loop containing nucleoside triphosphate hydrolase protein [Mycena maculata]|uniref:P-loop containing nucleoside triphosphate hydrolase protein n=1 Tax=Mycena maculata TaxID=230809 RepID=A0AAD7JL35_9AGAR|nr:P-loop containing nucleoside triphosphate hydrolase protein [Mycena maculata]
MDADDFVNILGDVDVDNDFYRTWLNQASAKHSSPTLQAANALRKIYPDHSLVITYQNVLRFPALLSAPLPHAPLVTATRVSLTQRRGDTATGILVDSIEFGAFTAAWGNHDFTIYVLTWVQGFGTSTMHFVLHQGPEDHPRSLVLAAGLFDQSLHEEIWVFNQGFWKKDHGLWVDVQTADWKDVVLKDEFKKNLKKDVYGFFKSEAIYKELAIPWKRGLILWGPPGNGKTISIKVIVKTCDALGFAPLYVKSFQSYKGEEGAMMDVFDKARQLSPCVIVLEDLDALINDRNRSFFLNQLDGLQGNDGLLVIGTTNHFERLDPGLSTRPSRFDRKYLFDDPSREERALYVKYWQNKLKSNKEIEFPDSLVDEVTDLTPKFSFAYLKEAFVSTLVTLAGWEDDDKPVFGDALKKQIKTLRKQLDKAPSSSAEEAKRDFRPLFDTLSAPRPNPFAMLPSASSPPSSAGERNIRALLDRLATEANPSVDAVRGARQHLDAFLLAADSKSDFRPLFDTLSGTPNPFAAVFPPASASGAGAGEGERDVRALLDRVAANGDALGAVRKQLDALLFMSGAGSQQQSAAPSAWDSPFTHAKLD